jgi:uncharacterized membrane protein
VYTFLGLACRCLICVVVFMWCDVEEAQRRSRTSVGVLYGGVLTLCVYGTAEATDQATGSAYTEYIVQCTWGPTEDHRRPWVVARRWATCPTCLHSC